MGIGVLIMDLNAAKKHNCSKDKLRKTTSQKQPVKNSKKSVDKGRGKCYYIEAVPNGTALHLENRIVK